MTIKYSCFGLRMLIFILVLFLCSDVVAGQLESVCYGTTEQGRLENGWKLPSSGKNFQSYSRIGTALGRTYVHSKVYRVVVGAYKDLETSANGKVFLYGETGWAKGGRFRPHKTHQNGLSVDFFVPVVNDAGNSVVLPTSIFNKFGYNIEFSNEGKYKVYTIDFDALADHLLALKKNADKHGLKIRRVIFDNDLQEILFKTSRGRLLQESIQFSKMKPWVRHDEHYHVDFEIECKR